MRKVDLRSCNDIVHKVLFGKAAATKVVELHFEIDMRSHYSADGPFCLARRLVFDTLPAIHPLQRVVVGAPGVFTTFNSNQLLESAIPIPTAAEEPNARPPESLPANKKSNISADKRHFLTQA